MSGGRTDRRSQRAKKRGKKGQKRKKGRARGEWGGGGREREGEGKGKDIVIHQVYSDFSDPKARNTKNPPLDARNVSNDVWAKFTLVDD